MSMSKREKLETLNIHELRDVAREIGVPAPTKLKQAELVQSTLDVLENRIPPSKPSKRGKPAKSNININELLQWIFDGQPQEVRQDNVELMEEQPKAEQPQQKENIFDDKDATGILEIMPDGYGFLRMENYSNSLADIYVPPQQIKRLSLHTGDKIFCKARLFKDKRCYSLIYVYTVNDVPCSELKHGVKFEELISCYPNERIVLERDKTDYALRLIDLVAPIGKGQRGLIVSPPKAGKTTLLKKIAQAVRANYPNIYLNVLLVDERPEEVTDFKQSVNCDVWYSTFDQGPEHHIKIAEMVIKNAKRRVEQGQDVMILMDSITRLGRAYNQTAEQSGRTLTGGLDISALQEPKRFFGAGRNVEGKGSLTILATALIDTNSKMDDIIYEEFKGTGNMEIHLDRRMSERRIFPAIDLNRSGTRREDLLLTPKQLEGMWLIRRALAKTDSATATEQMIDLLMTTSNNDEFIDMMKVIAKKQKT
jgi:transcription termination factor Rho